MESLANGAARYKCKSTHLFWALHGASKWIQYPLPVARRFRYSNTVIPVSKSSAIGAIAAQYQTIARINGLRSIKVS
jgi:hypothetical protein